MVWGGLAWALPSRLSLFFVLRESMKEEEQWAVFNIGFSELLLVLLVAFVVVGPKDLPKVARWLARVVKKSRRLINEVKKESGWADLEKEVNEVSHDVKDAVKQGDISEELRETKKSVQDSAEKFKHDTKSN